MRCRSRSVVAAGHGDGVLGGRRRCIFLEDGLDLHVGTRHGELVVLDGHAAADDLPLLEVVALVGRGGQGDHRTGRSGGRSCGAGAFSVIADGDGVGGGGNNAVFPQRLDFGIPAHGVEISHLVLRAADLPSLELLIGGSGEAALGQDVICPCLDGHGIHAAAAGACVEGDRTIRKRRALTHRDLRIGAGKVVVILRIADEVIASGQVINLRAAARRIAAFACHTVFHLISHAADFAVAAAHGGGRDTDQAVRSFPRGFADAPRCGYGVGAVIRPFAGLRCDANGVIARVRAGVAGDVHSGGIIASHGRCMLGAIVGVGSCNADAGLGRVGRRRRCILLEDCLDLYIAVRHGELIVLDAHAAADDLPLLEVVALVGHGGQGDLRTGRSLCGRCGSRSVAAAGHGDGILGRRRRRVLLEDCFDLHVGARHGELIVGDYKPCRRFDLPLLEVVAGVGRSGQGDLRTGRSLCGRCGSRSAALCGHSDSVLRGCGRRILLKNGLDLHVVVRHGELIVLDAHAAADDLPLLEVIALVGRSAQCDLRTGNSLCGRCRSRAVAAAGHGDGMLGRRRRRVLLEDCFDLYIAVRHEELIVLDGHAAADDLPLLEVVALVGRSGQGDLRTSHSLVRRCGSRSVALCGHGDGKLGGRRRCILLEDCLDLYIAVRHSELVVGDYKSCRRFDLPLLKVVALVGRSGQGDLRIDHSFCMRGGSRSAALCGHGDGMLGRRGFGYRNRQLLRIAARAVGGLDGELEIAGLGGRTLDGVAHQRQAVGQSAANAPCDRRSAVGGQGLAVRLAHLAVRQGVRGDGHAMAAGSKLRRQLGYIRRNVISRFVELAIAAKPLKVVVGISVGAGQAVGRRRGKALAAFHNDLNILRAITQLAAVKIEGNGFQPVRAQ